MSTIRIPVFQSLVSRFRTERTASVLPLFGILVILLIVAAGAAVDVTRTVSAREKLAYALDAAALSVAADLSTSFMSDTQIKQALSDSFKANLAGEEFLDDAIANLSFDVDSDNGTVTVTSSAALDNYFIDLGGYMKESLGPETFTFGTSSQVSFSRFNVEMAMVLDVTGSMQYDMDTLRSAAKSVVNILIPDGTSEADSKVRISLVPYSQGVNLGSYAEAVTDGEATSANCVNEREGTEKFTDVVYNYLGEESDFFHGRPEYHIRVDGSREYVYGSTDSCPDGEIIPLTSNRETLVDEISDLTHGGGTGGQTGIAWGWYTLSPNWAPLWPVESDPEPYANDDALKFALVMTDGDFNAEYSRSKVCDRRGNCSTSEHWVERYHNNSDYDDPPAVRARALCDAMKKSGIKVYAVYFDTGGSAFGDDLMNNCSSGSGYYYEADSPEELITAFGNIAKKIQSIYLSK